MDNATEFQELLDKELCDGLENQQEKERFQQLLSNSEEYQEKYRMRKLVISTVTGIPDPSELCIEPDKITQYPAIIPKNLPVKKQKLWLPFVHIQSPLVRYSLVSIYSLAFIAIGVFGYSMFKGYEKPDTEKLIRENTALNDKLNWISTAYEQLEDKNKLTEDRLSEIEKKKNASDQQLKNLHEKINEILDENRQLKNKLEEKEALLKQYQKSHTNNRIIKSEEGKTLKREYQGLSFQIIKFYTVEDEMHVTMQVTNEGARCELRIEGYYGPKHFNYTKIFDNSGREHPVKRADFGTGEQNLTRLPIKIDVPTGITINVSMVFEWPSLDELPQTFEMKCKKDTREIFLVSFRLDSMLKK